MILCFLDDKVLQRLKQQHLHTVDVISLHLKFDNEARTQFIRLLNTHEEHLLIPWLYSQQVTPEIEKIMSKKIKGDIYFSTFLWESNASIILNSAVKAVARALKVRCLGFLSYFLTTAVLTCTVRRKIAQKP